MRLKRRTALWFVVGLLALAGLVLVAPNVRWRMVGALRSEAFYAGRPTSFWREELREHEVESGRAAPLAPSWLTQGEEKLGLTSTAGSDAFILVHGGSETIPVLLELLSDKDVVVRCGAAKVLGDHDSSAEAVVPALTRALNDDDFWVRRQAAMSLVRLTPNNPVTVPAVLTALTTDLERLRSFHTTLTNRGGPGEVRRAAEWHAGNLLYHRKDAARRFEAAETLTGLQTDTPEVRSALLAGLRDTNPYVRVASARALAVVQGDNKEEVSELIEALHDDDPAVRKQAAQTLKALDPKTALKAGVP